MSDNATKTVDLSSVSSGSSQDTESASLDGSNLVLTMSDNKTKTVDLKAVMQLESIVKNANSIAQNVSAITLSTTEIASLGSNLNSFKQVT